MADRGTTKSMRVLEWDSDFFAFPIARIEPAALMAGGVAEWCRERGIRCAYLLVDAGDALSLRLAGESEFRTVDVRVTLTAAREGRPLTFDGVVRPANESDVPALVAIARSAHRDSRFYADGHFDSARCDDLFAHWIERSCRGWADHVLVFDAAGHAAGYVTLHARGERAEIGLVGVHEHARGRGGASALLADARRWCASRALTPVTVVTQGGNRGALGLYQAAGFDVTHIEVWYHRWFPSP